MRLWLQICITVTSIVFFVIGALGTFSAVVPALAGKSDTVKGWQTSRKTVYRIARKRRAEQGLRNLADNDPNLISMVNHVDYLVNTGSVTLLWPNWDSVIWIVLGSLMAVVSLAFTIFVSTCSA